MLERLFAVNYVKTCVGRKVVAYLRGCTVKYVGSGISVLVANEKYKQLRESQQNYQDVENPIAFKTLRQDCFTRLCLVRQFHKVVSQKTESRVCE